MTLQNFITTLSDSAQPLKASGLLLFSGLLPEDIDDIREPWQRVAAPRRLELTSQLAEMADESANLDFHTFFCYSMGDPDSQVRERAIAGLWESSDRSLIPLLIDRLANDDAVEVRAAAATTLGRFATLAQSGNMLQRDSDRVYQALLAALCKDEEPLDVRRRALEAVGAFPSDEVREWVRWGYNSPEPRLRQSALYAMGRSCDTSWLTVIFQEIENTDPAMRYEAANACREMGEEEAVPHLAVLLRDDDLEVQVSAIHALGAIGGTKAKRLLRQCVNSFPNNAAGEAAQAALDMIDLEEFPLHFKPVR